MSKKFASNLVTAMEGMSVFLRFVSMLFSSESFGGGKELTFPAGDEGPFDATALLEQRSFPAYFRSGEQQDSEEFFRCLIGALMETNSRRAELAQKAPPLTSFIRSKSGLPSLSQGLQDWEKQQNHLRVRRKAASIGFEGPPRSPFEGMEASSIKCQGCGHVPGVKYDNFLNLNLCIPRTRQPFVSLEKCMEHYTRAEFVEDFLCAGCSSKQTVQKRTLVGRYPEALCLHLQIATGGGIDEFSPYKVNTFVRFPEILDMAPYHVSAHPSFFGASAADSESSSLNGSYVEGVSAPLNKARVVGGDTSFEAEAFFSQQRLVDRTASPAALKVVPYTLRAVIVHHGSGVGAGHFTSFRRLLRSASGAHCSLADTHKDFIDEVSMHSRWDDQWVAVSDAKVRAVPKEDVLSSNAYMLFYDREGHA